MPISSSEGVPISRGSGIDWGALGAGTLGAVDEALFGIPEFVAKKIDRKGVQDYIDKNAQAYHTGETVGTIGSMFIPLPGMGLIKGASAAGKVAKGVDTALDVAKLAKGADTALDVARLAKGADTAADVARLAGVGEKTAKAGIDWAKLAKLAKAGAISGAAEAGVRGVTSEKKPQDILKDIATGGAFGAAGGLAGGAISEALPRLTREAKKGTELAYLGTTDMKSRQALSYLKDMAGSNAKGIGKLKAVDNAREELYRVGKEIGAHVPGKLDDAVMKHAAMWDAIDNAVEAIAPNVRGSDLYTEAAKSLDMDKLYKEFGEKEVNAFLKKTFKDGADRSGVANSRQFLRDIVDASYNPSTIKNGKDAGIQRMQRQIAQGLRSGVDDTVQKIAEKAGLDIDFAKLKRDYLPMRAFAESAARADITPARVNMGSQTAEKLATQKLMEQLGMAGVGGALGASSSGEDPMDKVKGAAIGALGGAIGSRAIGSLATRGIAATGPVASKLASLVAKISPEALQKGGAIVGGQAAAIIGNKAIQEAEPSTPKEQSAAETGANAGTGNQPAYMSKIFDEMKAYAQANGVSETDPQFGQFVKDVYAMTGGFAPDQVGAILYKDPAERAAYTKALMVSRRLSEVMPTATQKAPGLFSGETKEQKIERLAAVDQLASIVGDVAKEKGSEAAAKKSLNIILTGNEPPERKSELVKMLLLSYGVDLDQLSQMGVV